MKWSTNYFNGWRVIIKSFLELLLLVKSNSNDKLPSSFRLTEILTLTFIPSARR